MILSLIVILASFIWLLLETDYLRVRLLVGRVKSGIPLLNAAKVEEIKLLTVGIPEPIIRSYSEFVTLEFPITEGSLNIGCKAE